MPLALRPFESPNSMVSRYGSQALRPADALAVAAGWGRQYRARVGGHFGSIGRFCRLGVGGHFVGRFCRRTPSPTTRWTQAYACRSQIISGGFSADTGGLLNLAQRPTEPPQCYDLLFLFLVQDIAHIDRG